MTDEDRTAWLCALLRLSGGSMTGYGELLSGYQRADRRDADLMRDSLLFKRRRGYSTTDQVRAAYEGRFPSWKH